MSFSPDWLDLREPADHTARDAALLACAEGCLDAGGVVLDLGCGTGSTVRAFGAAVPRARWRLLDADATLLEVAGDRHPGAQRITGDLGQLDALPLEDVRLVTASALLDLMPEAWIAALARRLAEAGVSFYAALNYNGQMRWTPGLPDDAAITRAFNRHQLGDKGSGKAAGPQAAALAAGLFAQAGFRVSTAESPWRLGADQEKLHGELLTGIANAASEMGNGAAEGWLTGRWATLPAAKAVIGHTDILAIAGQVG